MENVIAAINHKIDANKIEMHGLSYLDQDMRNYLDNKAVLFYVDCRGLRIKIDSLINRIVFKRCNDIKLNIGGLVSGIELNRCSKVKVDCTKTKPINAIIVENSIDVDIRLSKEFLQKTYYEIDKSKDIKIMDMKKKIYLRQ